MVSPSPPLSYTSLHLPQISLSHHPDATTIATPIIIISLNRVSKNNAFTSEMEHSLVTAFDLLDLDDRVKGYCGDGKRKNVLRRRGFGYWFE